MPTPSSIVQLIESSGNNFHAKVARWFNGSGWHVTVSPYYMDQTQSKAREIDLVAEKLWPTTDTWGTPQGYVAVRLFIECKFIASESVFWFAPKDLKAATRLVCRTSPFTEGNRYTQNHHYLATCETVGKLFTSSNAKAQESEPFYKALNQALNATVSLRLQAPSHPALQGRRHGTLVNLSFPVVVCSSFSELYAVDFFKDTPATQINENFQLEVQYAYLDRSGNPQDDYFLLDIVEYGQLSAFEKSLAKGVEAAAFLSRRD